MREITRASAWGGFSDLVRELGGDPTRILAMAKVDAAMLADGERYLPLRYFIESLAIATEQLKRTDFGLLFGQKQDISMLGALSLAILNAKTVRQAFDIAARFMHTHNPASSMSLAPMIQSDWQFMSTTIVMRDNSRREPYDERAISNIHKSLRLLGGAAYQPRAVWFTHARLAPMSAYVNIFGVEPEFEKPAMGIALEPALLDSWRPGGSDDMRKVAEAYLIQQSAPRDANVSISVASMARSLLQGGEFTPEQTANALGMHARTLQRRLREEGSTFEKIKDDARREWAVSLLRQPSVSLTQIADMLGYADSSAFSRSCRRWFGQAPRTYRARLSGSPAPQPTPRPSRVNSLDANMRARRRADV